MAKIISIIPKRHLVTFKMSDKSKLRGCGYYDYKAFVESDNGKISSLSVDESDIIYNTIEEIMQEQLKDEVTAFDDVVTKDCFNEFVKAKILIEGDTPLAAFEDVLFILKESKCKCITYIQKLIDDVYPVLE